MKSVLKVQRIFLKPNCISFWHSNGFISDFIYKCDSLESSRRKLYGFTGSVLDQKSNKCNGCNRLFNLWVTFACQKFVQLQRRSQNCYGKIKKSSLYFSWELVSGYFRRAFADQVNFRFLLNSTIYCLCA